MYPNPQYDIIVEPFAGTAVYSLYDNNWQKEIHLIEKYDVIVDLALEALDYDSKVLINAPFTRELRDKEYMRNLKAKLKEKGAELVIIWVETDIEVCHQRMISRNSDRDTWKLENWDEYISGCNFERPEEINDPTCVDDILIFKNSSEEEFKNSIDDIVKKLNED